jgi:hypothetical protein
MLDFKFSQCSESYILFLDEYPGFEFYMPTFRNTLFHYKYIYFYPAAYFSHARKSSGISYDIKKKLQISHKISYHVKILPLKCVS